MALIVQGVLVALAWLGLNIVPAIFFKWNGDPRRELPERKMPAVPRQKKIRPVQPEEIPEEEVFDENAYFQEDPPGEQPPME